MSRISKRALTELAKRRLLELLESPDDKIALIAAIEILDCARGIKRPRYGLDPSQPVNDQDLEHLAEAMSVPGPTRH
jgi:hypothetical protein